MRWAHGGGSSTVQVKVCYGGFTALTRQVSVDEPLSSATELYRLGYWLLAKHRLVSHLLRLLGLGVSGFAELTREQLQLSLEPPKANRR